MKISQIFVINKSQAELDFVDIDSEQDKLLFIDPFLLSNNTDPWSLAASHTLQSFFQHVLDNIRTGRINQARQAFRHLHEPNETCLGMSNGLPRGRGVGTDNATELFNAIQNSDAVQSGLVEDIQDTNLFIENIGRDKISDMTTNIIRKHLVEYTISQADLWDIPLREATPTGFYWDEESLDWRNELSRGLVIKNRKILLVPKSAVSLFRDYSASTYHQHDALNFLQADHLRRNTPLVKSKTLKDRSEKRWVPKDSIAATELPLRKAVLVDFTRRNPAVFDAFKARMKAKSKPLENEEIDSSTNLEALTRMLVDELNAIPSGKENANAYHNLIKGIGELIFYPNLVSPTKETPIHGGRKRIDVVFRNAAKNGFFAELAAHHSSNYIPVECKNYAESRDLANPEFDQMLGRLAPARGIFGIITCRTAENPNLLRERSRDAYSDNNKIVIYFTDNDLITILNAIGRGEEHPEYPILQRKVDEIIVA